MHPITPPYIVATMQSPAGGDCGETFEQITEAQLLSYLKGGWQLVHRLASGEVIVRK